MSSFQPFLSLNPSTWDPKTWEKEHPLVQWTQCTHLDEKRTGALPDSSTESEAIAPNWNAAVKRRMSKLTPASKCPLQGGPTAMMSVRAQDSTVNKLGWHSFLWTYNSKLDGLEGGMIREHSIIGSTNQKKGTSFFGIRKDSTSKDSPLILISVLQDNHSYQK